MTLDSLLNRSHSDWLADAAKLDPPTKLYLDGAYTDAASGATFDTLPPATVRCWPRSRQAMCGTWTAR